MGAPSGLWKRYLRRRRVSQTHKEQAERGIETYQMCLRIEAKGVTPMPAPTRSETGNLRTSSDAVPNGPSICAHDEGDGEIYSARMERGGRERRASTHHDARQNGDERDDRVLAADLLRDVLAPVELTAESIGEVLRPVADDSCRCEASERSARVLDRELSAIEGERTHGNESRGSPPRAPT